MESNEFTVALFAFSPEGIRLLARSADPGLVDSVRELLTAERRRDLARLCGSPVRAVLAGDRASDGDSGTSK
ncbi:MAG: hypothetical protein IH881_09495 [Myxococcales bacterium]|nr:hypothetical protein [Myxococcales bacterium]